MSLFQRYKASSNKYWFALFFIFVLALALRLWGIKFGLPYIYHFDEHFYVATALRLGSGQLHNTPYAPTGFANILFVEYAIYFVIGRLLGWFASASEFEMLYRRDPTHVYLLGRMTSAALGALTVLTVYKIGSITTDKARYWTGLIAAFFLSASFLHARDSHYAVPDVAMAFFVTLSVFFAVYALRHHSRNALLLAGLAGGLAVAMKWTALPVVLPVWWASAFMAKGSLKFKLQDLVSRLTILAGLASFLGFAIGSPQILLNPMLYINEALGQFGAGSSGGFEIWQVDTLPGWLFYGKTLIYGVGISLLLLGTVGALRRLFLVITKRDQMSVVLLLFPLVYYLLMGSTRHYFARYSVPLIPFLALFAAEVLVVGTVWLTRQTNRKQWLRPLLIGLSLLVIFPSFLSLVRHNVLLTRQDTRTEAKAWIESNLPEGVRIAVDWETHVPPLATREDPVPDSDKTYDVVVIGGSGLADRSLDWYREQDFEYLITTSYISEIPLVDPQRQERRQTFYESLAQLDLINEFTPWHGESMFVFDEIYGPVVGLWQREQPGPIIKIYRLEV
jgi:hypothetical protein